MHTVTETNRIPQTYIKRLTTRKRQDETNDVQIEIQRESGEEKSTKSTSCITV